MATILEQYRQRQNAIREQLAAGSLPPEELLIMQELNYRICVLESFEAFTKSAPETLDTRVMGFHFQLVDAYVRFTLAERNSVQKLMQTVRRNAKPHIGRLNRWRWMGASALPVSTQLRRISIRTASTTIFARFCPFGCSIVILTSIFKEDFCYESEQLE